MHGKTKPVMNMRKHSLETLHCKLPDATNFIGKKRKKKNSRKKFATVKTIIK